MPLIEGIHHGRILIVDDEPAIVRLLTIMLETAGYKDVHGTSDPRLALMLIAELDPDLVVLDLSMPHMSGFDILDALRRAPKPDVYFPVLVLTGDARAEAKERALSAGAKDFLLKPFESVEALLRIRSLLETRLLHLRLREHNLHLEARVQERTRAIEHAYVDTIHRLGRAAEHRDDATGEHTRRVADMAGTLGRELGMPRDRVEALTLAATLHDLGKIGVPDRILLKHGMLTVDELEIMRRHSAIGAELLSGSRSPVMQLARQIALTHHERWDGNGYPNGLAGEDIPLAGRIAAVADAFDAITHERPYKKAWPVDHALVEIERCIGAQFDPRVAEVFIRLVTERAFAQAG